MKVLLVLLLITADGPKQTALEMQTIEECWIRAQAVIANADLAKMRDAGVNGVGTGCIVIPAPAQESNR